MDKYYHLLEGNCNGKKVRWISKIKVEFNSKNKHLLLSMVYVLELTTPQLFRAQMRRHFKKKKKPISTILYANVQ